MLTTRAGRLTVPGRSVSGGVVMRAGGPVSWYSQTQKCVTLLTTQAEHVAMSDVAKEILFLIQVFHVAKGRCTMHSFV